MTPCDDIDQYGSDDPAGSLAAHLRTIHGWTVLGHEETDLFTLKAMHMAATASTDRFNIILQPVDDIHDPRAGISPELFLFGKAGGTVLNYGHPHRIVHAYGQHAPSFEALELRPDVFADSTGQPLRLLAPLNLGDFIFVDGIEYQIAARRGHNPHLVPVSGTIALEGEPRHA